jgi:hypothetical protein
MTKQSNSQHLYMQAYEQARENAGEGWKLLGHDLRAGLVAYQVCLIISQNEENAGYEKAAKLVDEMLAENYTGGIE